MVNVTRTFTVDQDVDTVVAYLADFANAVQWDPGTESCTQTTPGPVAVGTKWHNVSKILGMKTELEYTLEKLEPGHLTLVGHNDTATSTDDITVRPAPGGSEITYDSTVDLHGAAKLGTPIVKIEFEKLGNQTVEGIQSAMATLRR